MHEIEPFYNWLKYYKVDEDQYSPYFGKEYNYELYTDTIYGYYIDPARKPLSTRKSWNTWKWLQKSWML